MAADLDAAEFFKDLSWINTLEIRLEPHELLIPTPPESSDEEENDLDDHDSSDELVIDLDRTPADEPVAVYEEEILKEEPEVADSDSSNVPDESPPESSLKPEPISDIDEVAASNTFNVPEESPPESNLKLEPISDIDEVVASDRINVPDESLPKSNLEPEPISDIEDDILEGDAMVVDSVGRESGELTDSDDEGIEITAVGALDSRRSSAISSISSGRFSESSPAKSKDASKEASTSRDKDLARKVHKEKKKEKKRKKKEAKKEESRRDKELLKRIKEKEKDRKRRSDDREPEASSSSRRSPSLIHENRPGVFSLKEIRDEQDKDDLLMAVKESLASGKPESESVKFFMQQHKCLSVTEGLLTCKFSHRRLMVIPEHLVKRIIQQTHEAPKHLSARRTQEELERRYYWPFMYDTVKDYVENCSKCSKGGETTETIDID